MSPMGARTPRAPVAQFALDAGTLSHVRARTQIRSRRFEPAHARFDGGEAGAGD
jgi:hypothetical protein